MKKKIFRKPELEQLSVFSPDRVVISIVLL